MFQSLAGIQEVVAPTRAAVEAARRAGLKIIYLKIGFQADLSDLGTNGGAQEHFFAHMGIPDGEGSAPSDRIA